MAAKKPPLDAVRVARSAVADAAEARLRAAVASEAAARTAAADAAQAEASARADSAIALEREHHGLRSPRELLQHAAFGWAEQVRLDALATQAAEAARTAEAASARTDEARSALTAARAGVEVVERHQARVRAAERARAEDQVAEQAEEAHQGRRGTSLNKP